MKQYDINKAYQSLRRLSEVELPVKKAYAIYKLLKVFEEPFRFELEFERKLMQKYEASIEDGGMMRFPDIEKAEGFQKEIEEANGLEVEVDFQPIILKENDFESCSITAADIMNLEGVVVFE